MYAEILRGLGAGFVFALTTFAKKQGEPFDFAKFGTTLLIGAGAGVVNGLVDLPVSSGYEFMITLGAVPIIENLLKIGYRKGLKLLDKFL